jgi:class 3 adenylate cyclase
MIATTSPETSAESSSAHDENNNNNMLDLSHSDVKSLMSDNDDSTNHSGGSSTNKNAIDEAVLHRQRYLAISRCAALLLVLAFAAAAGAATFILTTKQHEEAVINQAELLAGEVLTVSNAHLEEVSSMMTAMISSMSVLAESSGAEWPYYTQPDFSTIFGQAYLDNSGATLLSWSPFIGGDLQRVRWGNYSTVMASDWLPQPLADQVPSQIYTFVDDDGSGNNDNNRPVVENGPGPFVPVWQMAVDDPSIPMDPTAINYNLLSNPEFAASYTQIMTTHTPAMTSVLDATLLYGNDNIQSDSPTCLLLIPIFEGSDDYHEEHEENDDTQPLATLVAVLPFEIFLRRILHDDQPNVYVVIEQDESCGQATAFTYDVDGETAIYLGQGELYDPQYGKAIATSSSFGKNFLGELCQITMTVYPSAEVYQTYGTDNNAAAIWTAIVVLMILLAGVVFFSYDFAVIKRQQKTLETATKTNTILSSLYPAEVVDRLLGKNTNNKKTISTEKEADGGEEVQHQRAAMPESTKFRLKNYLAEEDGAMGGGASGQNGASGIDVEHDEKVREALAGIDMHETKPIAELFPNTTVMFADIAGFTAWSSVREPSQVFVLLETVYRAFDNIAKRRKVFKVETVGDCYVAVTGLPEPRKDHAVVMAKFAKDCLEKFNELSKLLEIKLGPDTGDLAMRAGLHSGPVTAGVLRGDKSRFQLFGDTVNTAARVESTGMRNRVHLSTDTANLLKEVGKEHWVRK